MRRLFLMAALVLSGLGARAQQPAVVNGTVATEAATGGLEATLMRDGAGAAAVWVGYAVPVEGGYRSGWQRDGLTRLEGGGGSYGGSYTGYVAVQQDHAALLVRMQGGAVTELRTAALDDKLDVGGLRFVWLTGVSPEESVATLLELAQRGATLPLRLRSGDGRATPVFLIALHRSDAAVPALVKLTAPGGDEHVREQAAFWLANQRGRAGFEAVRKLAREDGDAGFRTQLTFDLTLTKDPDGVRELIRMGREDASPTVRQQAHFWLAQQYNKQAAGHEAILEAILDALRAAAATDPDEGTRTQVAFAMTLLPHVEATAELTRLAQTSTDRAVKQQAVFWLGQSKDPKALEYLGQVLGSRTR